ncbi:MAG TPA: indole-3-glycerol phosphate synthase TrpC [Pyrinomonadaceae bacterium]|nr:indole-3-glycerol phosphate synthase TrpC [Pyrinomonadaceae bacterium]
MNILSEIIARKQQQVEAAKQTVALQTMRDSALRLRSKAKDYRLRSALSSTDRINIIAEFKRRSPSKGVIRNGADPTQIARDYASAGAAAISVLTEENYFDGSLDDLRAVRDVVRLPILRKDFIFDEYQIYEAACAGADAILLIVSALDDPTLTSLRQIAEDELGLDTLVEVHDKLEMKRANQSGAKLIGVNNRDLRTFEVSLETSLKLADIASADAVLISESGLKTMGDLLRLQQIGYRGFLIGESLMRAESPGEALAALIKNSS